jgi:hypothetical protein
VFGMGTGGSSSLGSPRTGMTGLAGAALWKCWPQPLNIDGLLGKKQRMLQCVCSRDYGQAERAISNGQLNALLRLHTRPIKLVVYQCSC